MNVFRTLSVLLPSCLGLGLAGHAVQAQETSHPAPPDVTAHGQVIISSEHLPEGTSASTHPDVFPKVPVTNEERSAIAVSSLDLDLHLTPADAHEEGRVLITLRNTSSKPVTRLPLQISSSLRWESLLVEGDQARTLPFTQSPVTTDADHTGYAQEAVLTLDQPLAPGGTLVLSAFYSGEIRQSSDRLKLIGTPAEQADKADWDQIAPTSDAASTALRGFGDVLWYPVAAPTAVFDDGNALFNSIAQQRRLNTVATMRLRLTVLYTGDPPDDAIFNGQARSLIRTPDTQDQVVDDTHGIATAEFALTPIGFRAPSLFLTAQQPKQTASPLLSVISPVPEAADPYVLAAQNLQPLFTGWLGPDPLSPLILFEHPGAPFEDGAFLAAHLSPSAEPAGIAPEIVRGLTHAYFRDSAPASAWLDQGLPEFMSLLRVERNGGREAAVDQLQENAKLIALSEPDIKPGTLLAAIPEPSALILASADVFLRLKSAAVLWQLRDILGEDDFRTALLSFRHSLAANPAFDRDETSFEKLLQRSSGRDLGWFFNDWVYRDRGLPDLEILQVDPRPLPSRPGKNAGYLVAVVVRNEGDAVAEVPVTVSSGGTGVRALTSTERLRIPGHTAASTRILFEGTPENVQVNDGSVPEIRTSLHTREIVIQTK